MTRRVIIVLLVLTGLGVAIASASMGWRAIGAAIVLASLVHSLWEEVHHEKAAIGVMHLVVILGRRQGMRAQTFDHFIDEMAELHGADWLRATLSDEADDGKGALLK